MSLFGQPKPGDGQASGTSLFGGNTVNTTSQPGGGLFGGAGATASPAQGTSLFGSNAAQQQNQAPKPSLFGAAPSLTPTASAQKPPSAGLFGTANSQAQPASTGGLGFSTLAANNTNTQGTSSVFGTSELPSTTADRGPPSNTTGYFDSLLAKSKKQANGESPLEDLPSLQLGLGDLHQRLRKLAPRAADPLQHGKAQYMLAASGVDPGTAAKDLNLFNVQSGRVERSATAPAATEVDVEQYLANLQSKTTLSMIADGLERSARDFDHFLEDNITTEWDAQRKRIYEHFGIKTQGDASGARAGDAKDFQGGFGRSRRSVKAGRTTAPGPKASAFGRSNLQKSVIGTPSKIGPHPDFGDVKTADGSSGTLGGAASIDDRFLREKQAKLAVRVRQLNDSRIQKTPYPILDELAQVEGRGGDQQAQHMVDAYRAVMAIVGEKPEAETFANDATARERGFKDMYMDLNPKSANSVAMRKRILTGANRFLEKQYFQEVESVITRFPKEANLGGRPDVISKIKAYVRLRHARKDLVPDNAELQQNDGEYIWALVYYLLRTGHVDEAAEYVKSRTNTFRSIDRTFSSYLLEYAASPDRRLRRQLQERCNNEYSQRARMAPNNSIDPYRMACYKIVGRCEVNNRSLDGLNTDINDWIWLQFNLARENERTIEVASESYTLLDLQASIQEIGNKHFPKSPSEDTNSTFGMFFFLQVLSGMFEKAIAYLYPFSYVDAIHFGIALEYYGLLRPGDPWSTANDLLSHDTRGNRQINFGRMLGYYTRDFRAANVTAAVDYLVLICLNADLEGEAGRQQAELCQLALRELVLETREFSKLIGDIRPDGQSIEGLIAARGPLIGLQLGDNYVENITLQSARFADDNGRTTDAVLLYHLAGDYDSVITIVSRALSEAISLEIGEDPLRLMPVKPRADAKDASAQPGSSLSLASIDDPVQLAMTMMTMYEKDASFYNKIDPATHSTCSLLLQMSKIKNLVEAGSWPESLDKIRALEILPLDANGDPTKIRHYASKFSGLSHQVAINVPNLLMWTVTCCIRQRDRLVSGQFSGNEGTRRMMCDNLKQISMDLTTYTSQLKYRFPPHLHEALARATAD